VEGSSAISRGLLSEGTGWAGQKDAAAPTEWDGGRGKDEIILEPAGSLSYSRLGSTIDKAGDVGFELGEIFVAKIHHVSRVVILQADVLLKFVR